MRRPFGPRLPFALDAALSVAAVVAVWGWVAASASSCPRLLIDVHFAGDAARFAASDAGSCALDAAREPLWVALFAVVVHVAVVARFLSMWHGPQTWRSEPGRSLVPAGWLVNMTLIGGASTVAAGVLALAGLGEDSTSLTLDRAIVITALAWPGWVLVAGTSLVAFLLLVPRVEQFLVHLFRWATSSSPHQREVEIHEWKPTIVESGVCCSGGGARSSAFCMGALSALESTVAAGRERNLLASADVLSSVSGGGYAAGAWRIAHGEGHPSETGLIGDPFDDLDELHDPYPDRADAPIVTGLYPYVRRRRDYPRNGPGGLSVTVPSVVLTMALHLAIIVLWILVLAWPLGRLAGSWAVAGNRDLSPEWRQLEIRDWLVVPFALPLVLAGLTMLPRAFTRRDERRRFWDARVRGQLAIALLVGCVTLGMPLAVDLVAPWVEKWVANPEAAAVYAFALAGGLASVVQGAVAGAVARRLPLFGGVALGFGLAVYGIVAAGRVAAGEEVLWIGDWYEYAVFLGFALAALVTVNPELWSTHRTYRRLLSGTYAARVDADGVASRLDPRSEPPLSSYAAMDGPRSVFCCSAARNSRDATGIPVVSLTFDPHEVVIHHRATSGATTSRAMSRTDYESLLEGSIRRPFRGVMGSVAVSGAAVSPSLGRADLGTTNSVLAALNVRMGAWLPNPGRDPGRYLVEEWAQPRLSNLFSELVGNFDQGADNLYVADGGHWENLGLVELLRREPEIVVSLDASKDRDHGELRLAIELARLETDARVEISDQEWAALAPTPGRPRAARSWCLGTITYASGRTGLLVFVKAQVSEASPADLLRYATVDPDFPTYATADQLLTDAAFHHLALLGRASMHDALTALDRLWRGDDAAAVLALPAR